MAYEQFVIVNKAANTTGEVETTTISADGSSKTVAVWATTWNGAIVTLRCSPDGGTTWIDITDNGTPVTFSANGVRLVDRLGQGMLFGAKITSVGASTAGIYARVF